MQTNAHWLSVTSQFGPPRLDRNLLSLFSSKFVAFYMGVAIIDKLLIINRVQQIVCE